jgi:Fe-S cluster assembly iron-binding protein IscA
MTRRGCLIVSALLVAGCNPGRPSTAQPQTNTDPPAVIVPKQEAPKPPESPRVVLTDRAAKQVRKLLAETPEAKYLRVSISDGRLKLDLDPTTDPKEDLLSESRSVAVLVDRRSAALLPVGIVVDYIDEEGTRGFKFASPGGDQVQPDTSVSLADARRGFKTTLRSPTSKGNKTPVLEPPAEVFGVVRYDAPPGKLAAYLTPDPKDGKKHPAIIWITGGDCNTIDAGCWKDDGVLVLLR